MVYFPYIFFLFIGLGAAEANDGNAPLMPVAASDGTDSIALADESSMYCLVCRYLDIPFVKAAAWIAEDLLHLDRHGSLAISLRFFMEQAAKMLFFIVVLIYLISLLRAGLDTRAVAHYLSGKSRFFGYGAAAVFGAVTPFCSCSSIPLFIGFTRAGIPVGITLSFLITSPMINEIAVVLLTGIIGWKFTVSYITVGIFAGILGGWFIDSFKRETLLKEFVLSVPVYAAPAGNPSRLLLNGMPPAERHRFAVEEVRSIFSRVWYWVFIGVGIGAIVYGYVPDALIVDTIAAGHWWTVPSAVLIGVPLYSHVTGAIPVVESLLLKGVPPGAAIAFMMSLVTVSLPEFMILKQVMKWKLLLLFFSFLLVMFILCGYLFDAIL